MSEIPIPLVHRRLSTHASLSDVSIHLCSSSDSHKRGYVSRVPTPILVYRPLASPRADMQPHLVHLAERRSPSHGHATSPHTSCATAVGHSSSGNVGQRTMTAWL